MKRNKKNSKKEVNKVEKIIENQNSTSNNENIVKEEKTQALIVIDKKAGKEKKHKKKKRHLILKFFLILVILAILLGIVGMWLFAGYLLGWFGYEFQISEDDLEINISNSVVVDKDGNVLANLSGDEKRKVISLKEMSQYLPEAYIAIEDERFYEHSGVDFKRTAGAIINTLIDGKSDYGGSTITQQLVKNITNDDESTGIEGIKRKIREWQRAYQVERMISKYEILELYLNILFIGGNNLHGVELRSRILF